MSKRANYSMINIMDMIQFACNDGVYPSYEGIRKRHPGFGAHHGTFTRIRDRMVSHGLVLPPNPRDRYTMPDGFMLPSNPLWVASPDLLAPDRKPRPAKKASSVRQVRLVASSTGPIRSDPKMPWRPIYARNWSEAQMIRLKAILDAVHDFRAAWKHLHLPPKAQHITGTNRCNGAGQALTVVSESKRKPNPRFTNPVEALPLNGEAPPWHPKGDGI